MRQWRPWSPESETQLASRSRDVGCQHVVVVRQAWAAAIAERTRIAAQGWRAPALLWPRALAGRARPRSIGSALLGPIGIAIVAAALNAGCAAGGGEAGKASSEPTAKTSQPQILPYGGGWGCGAGGAVGSYLFSSPYVINTIAADTSAVQNAQYRLYAMDSQGNLFQVNQQVHTATTAQQAMLATATNNLTATDVLATQTAQNAGANNATAQQFANQQDTTVATGTNNAFANNDTVVTHRNSANQNAWGNTANSAIASNAATANTTAVVWVPSPSRSSRTRSRTRTRRRTRWRTTSSTTAPTRPPRPIKRLSRRPPTTRHS